MIHARTVLTAAVATTLLGCATTPCTPMRVAPAPIVRTDYEECRPEGPGRTGTPAVVRYATNATDSLRHPDRTIAGPHTALCAPSAIAHGPTGELYVLNHAPVTSAVAGNEDRWMHWVTVYDSAAQGDATPIRTLHIGATGLLRPMSLGVNRAGQLHVGLGPDPRRDFGSILVFDADADGDVEPIRVLSGLGNGLRRPQVLAVDRRGYLYVTNAQLRSQDHAVRVFAPDAKGDAAACRVIAGPRTGLNRPTGLTLDRDGRLYVGNSGGSSLSPFNAITVFDAGATGDAAPIRTLGGGNRYDGMVGPDRLALGRGDSLYVRSAGSLSVFAPGATGASEPARYILRQVPGPQFARIHTPVLPVLDRHDTLYAVSGDTVMVYPPGYSGSEPPVRQIVVPRSGWMGVTDIALDDRGWLYLAQLGPTVERGLIRVYQPGASGNVPPSRTITGPRTRLSHPTGLALDRKRRLYVANGLVSGNEGAIRVYASGARGEDQPVRVLAGPATRLWEPTDIEFDSRGNMYVPFGYAPGVVSVFRPEASGDEAPVRTITGPQRLVRRTVALAVGPGDTLYALNVHGYGGRCDPRATGDATVTVYPPGANGEVEPARTLVLTQEGMSPGCVAGLGLVHGLAVDAGGGVQVWHTGGTVRFPPGAEGLAAPLQAMVDTTASGTNASGVTVTSDGWAYQTNVPSAGPCK